MEWPFLDPPNTAVLTSADIVERGKWIYYVTRDADDGTWQFHSFNGAPNDTSESRVVSLNTILKLDGSISALADLPLGWCAWRDERGAQWMRQKEQETAD